MPQPAPQRDAPEDVPIYDLAAVGRAYHAHRVRRRARLERTRARRYARLRFLLVIAILLALSVYVSLLVWREVQRLFGL